MKLKVMFRVFMLCCMTAATLLMTFILLSISVFGHITLVEPSRLILLSEIIIMLFASIFSLIHLFKYATKLARRHNFIDGSTR